MSVLLPTTSCRVLTANTTLDAHGHASTYAWTERGPFPAAVVRSGDASEDLTDLARAVYAVTVVLDPAAWPVKEADRLVDAEDGVYEVVGATLHRDPTGGGRLDHVACEARKIVGAL